MYTCTVVQRMMRSKWLSQTAATRNMLEKNNTINSFPTSAQYRSINSSNQLQQHQTAAWVKANPIVCLHDVHTELSAGGLPPNSPVTFKATLVENGKLFSSNAHFITDENGRVDLSEAESVGGSYRGIFPAGLITTLSSEPNEKHYYRLYRRNTYIPWKITVSIIDGHVDINANQDALAKIELERHLTAPGVQRLPVRYKQVRGTLYLPPGPGPFPGVIDIFGFVGGLFEFRSASLASRGIASLALAVFNYEDLPKAPDQLNMEYFEEATEFLLSQPKVIPDRCGTIVNSKSGDIGFNMGILFEPVKAVIGVNALTFQMHTQYDYKGEHYAKGLTLSTDMQTDKGGASFFHLGPYFNNNLSHMIPVEKADDDTYFLVACGDDDPFGFKESIQPFCERMDKHHKTNYDTILYPGAGHLIQTPYDSLVNRALQPSLPIGTNLEDRKMVTLKWGGTPQGNCNAQVDLWQRTQDFFNRHIRDESPWFQNYLQKSTPESQNVQINKSKL